jgi:steroid 5-alpha reductase family enzyme
VLSELLPWTAAGITIAMLGVWLLSLALRDASIVDIWWGLGFALVAWIGFAAGDGWEPRRLLVAGLTTAWGVRLGAYLFWRNHGAGEDPRYVAMRKKWGSRFPWVSLATVFALQGLMQWLVSMPVQAAQSSAAPDYWTALDILGTGLVLLGLACETTADLQLARFRADPENAGRVMDRGLWAWSRHPNYFGDAVVWWGIFCVACATPGGAWTFFAPALMTFLLLRISGVALMERHIGKRRPGYDEYVAHTSAFVPWFPKTRP